MELGSDDPVLDSVLDGVDEGENVGGVEDAVGDGVLLVLGVDDGFVGFGGLGFDGFGGFGRFVG